MRTIPEIRAAVVEERFGKTFKRENPLHRQTLVNVLLFTQHYPELADATKQLRDLLENKEEE